MKPLITKREFPKQEEDESQMRKALTPFLLTKREFPKQEEDESQMRKALTPFLLGCCRSSE
jgi:hypothetical protein